MAVPQVLIEIGVAAAAITAVVTAVLTLTRLQPIRWVWRTLVLEPRARFQREQIAHVVEPMFVELRNELRPNGGGSMVDRMNERFTNNDQRIDTIEAQNRDLKRDQLSTKALVVRLCQKLDIPTRMEDDE